MELELQNDPKKLKRGRRLFVISLLVVSLLSIAWMNTKYDSLSRYPYTDQKSRQLIKKYLNKSEIEYIIEYSIAPNMFIAYIQEDGFNIYHASEEGRKITVLQMFDDGFSDAGRVFQLKNWIFLVYVLLVLPFANITESASLTNSFAIPGFIMSSSRSAARRWTSSPSAKRRRRSCSHLPFLRKSSLANTKACLTSWKT